MEKRIKFKNLSGNLKFAVIGGYIAAVIYTVSFLYGFFYALAW